MHADTTPYLTALVAAASEAEVRELDYRRSVAEETARLERARQFAYRRLDLARTIVHAVREVQSGPLAIEAGGAALQRELGWNTQTPERIAVLEAFAPFTIAVWQQVRPPAEGADPAAAVPAAAGPGPDAVLATFESWYAEAFGSPFLARFDVDLPELPVVEF